MKITLSYLVTEMVKAAQFLVMDHDCSVPAKGKLSCSSMIIEYCTGNMSVLMLFAVALIVQ